MRLGTLGLKTVGILNNRRLFREYLKVNFEFFYSLQRVPYRNESFAGCRAFNHGSDVRHEICSFASLPPCSFRLGHKAKKGFVTHHITLANS